MVSTTFFFKKRKIGGLFEWLDVLFCFVLLLQFIIYLSNLLIDFFSLPAFSTFHCEDMDGIGRGRGLFSFNLTPTVGRGVARAPMTSTPMMPPLEEVDLNGVTHVECGQVGDAPIDTGNEGVSVNLIANIAQQIGQSIGESIASCMGSGSVSCKVGSGVTGNNSGLVDVSRLVLQSDIREPVCFRGDGSEKCTVHEWEDMVSTYMRKRGVPLEDQADDVLGRLMGRARDVVRVGVRSNPSIDLSHGPAPVFDILKRHFSDTAFSSMPLADFYATLPLAGEQAFDYWLRLNRAMDVAVDCLRRQNKSVEDPSRELSVMFIRHCPDPGLSVVFKCRPIHQWTAADVHERLEEHRREQRFSRPNMVAPALAALKQEVGSVMPPTTPAVGLSTDPSHPVSVLAQSPQASSESLERILTLLERVLEQRPQQSNRSFQRGNRNRVRETERSNGPCELCGDTGHSTYFHCRANHLCFLCHASGHARAHCPKAATLEPTGRLPRGNTAQPLGNE